MSAGGAELAPAGESHTVLMAPFFEAGFKPHQIAREARDRARKQEPSIMLALVPVVMVTVAIVGTILYSMPAGAARLQNEVTGFMGISQLFSAKAAVHQKNLILVVESDPDLRKVAQTTLTRQGFTVMLAASGGEATRVFGAQANDASLVILGSAPDILQTRKQIHDAQPNVKILVSKKPGTHVFSGLGSAALPRPYTAGQLTAAVTKAVGLAQ
jgi:hypothetical protein